MQCHNNQYRSYGDTAYGWTCRCSVQFLGELCHVRFYLIHAIPHLRDQRLGVVAHRLHLSCWLFRLIVYYCVCSSLDVKKKLSERQKNQINNKQSTVLAAINKVQFCLHLSLSENKITPSRDWLVHTFCGAFTKLLFNKNICLNQCDQKQLFLLRRSV